MSELEVVWSGAVTGPTRGYLIVPPDHPRAYVPEPIPMQPVELRVPAPPPVKYRKQPLKVRQEILTALRSGPKSVRDLMAITGRSRASVGTTASIMHKIGQIGLMPRVIQQGFRRPHGQYCLRWAPK